jgi:hypothetical protein
MISPDSQILATQKNKTKTEEASKIIQFNDSESSLYFFREE